MTKDYYAILGVAKTATADEIKKAYRKLALEHHPDRAGGTSDAKFKEVNEAYQTLSDPAKRQRYDQFGTADPRGFGGAAGFDDFFGGQGGGQGGFGFGNLSDLFESMMGEAIAQVQTELGVKLTDLLLGGTLNFRGPTGETLSLTIPKHTQSGTTFRFPGKGRAHKRGVGDLFVTLRLDLPRRLTKEQEKILEQLRQHDL